ncbi:MAG TPA: prohead protease/major capsid protein fusion protein [Thermodesulfobacteriota bacterium]
MTTHTVDLPPLSVRATVRPESINAEARTVEVTLAAGSPVVRYDWMTGQRYVETLAMDRKAVRLERLNNGAPLLNAHSALDVADVIGVIEPGSARIESGELRARVRFSKRDDRTEGIWRDVQDGILRNLSVGYRVHKYEETTGSDGTLPTRHAIDWEPYEGSLVPMGADDRAKVRADRRVEMNPCEIVSRALPDEEATTMPTAEKLAEAKAKAETAATRAAEDAEPATNGAAPDAEAIRRAEAAETARAAALMDLQANATVAAAGFDATFFRTHLEKKTPLDVVRKLIFDKLTAQSDATAGASHVRIEGGEDARDKWQRGVQAWLIQKAAVGDVLAQAKAKRPDHPAFRDALADPGEFRGLSLVDLARDCLEAAGIRTRGLDKMALVGKALTLRSAGYQTTSDFAVALENVLHKTLLAAYTVAPDTWRRFCAVGSVSDFRPHARYRTGFLGRLEVVREHGEFRNKAIPDAVKESISADTKGNILALSRQAIINDDMGIFSRIATQAGRMVALSIELDVYDLLKLNAGLGPTMNDGQTLFHASHGNINATGSALSVAGLDADRVVMATQTDPSGNETLDLRPAILLVPIGLGGEARVINDAQFDVDTVSGGQTNKFMKPNKVRGLFRDIVDTPHLSGTRRYLFADPALMPVLEVVFLEGQQEPFLETRDGWRIDGVEWKIRHDYGVGAIEVRGAVTNAGA